MLQALTILFIAFKLAGLIEWSWIKVLIPLWVEIGIWITYIIVKVIIY